MMVNINIVCWRECMLWEGMHALGGNACSGRECMLWEGMHALGGNACSGRECMLWEGMHALGEHFLKIYCLWLLTLPIHVSLIISNFEFD